jgi:flavodoxin
MLRILIILYSRTNNTLQVGKIIQDRTKGDIVEITSQKDYNRMFGYWVALKDAFKSYLPNVTYPALNFDNYDVVYLGSPVWGYGLGTPMRTFLTQVDFKGKTVIPFLTCGGSPGSSFEYLRTTAKNAKIEEGVTFKWAMFKNRKQIEDEVDKWLSSRKSGNSDGSNGEL